MNEVESESKPTSVNPYTAGLNVTNTGTVEDAENNTVAFEIFHGHNKLLARKADAEWATFHISIFDEIKSKNLPEIEFQEVINSIVMEDSHWSWSNKSWHYSSTEYEWFFMIMQNQVQGICVIFHPKNSHLENGKIFYVEFVAVAPWNRNTKISARKFKKIGTLLLKQASEYAINSLELKPGFSLLSLPQSESYYESLGMVEVVHEKKDGMKFYEMTQSSCESWGKK